MDLKDIIIAAIILAGAFYLLYRSLWKNKGHCSGCGEIGSEKERKNRSKRGRTTQPKRMESIKNIFRHG